MVYLIRHGLTQWNTGGFFRGTHDVQLSEEGRRQAHLLGKYLAGGSKKQKGAIIYTSPLSRARETASIIAGYTGSRVVSDDRLIDVDFGNWQGKDVSQIKEKYPEQYRIYKKNPEKAAFPGGETLQECFQRCTQRLFDLAPKNDTETAMLVSHRVVLKLLLIGVLDLPLSAFWKIQLDTCSISTVGTGDGTFVIKKINSTCHLTEGLDFTRDF